MVVLGSPPEETPDLMGDHAGKVRSLEDDLVELADGSETAQEVYRSVGSREWSLAVELLMLVVL